MFSSKKDKFFFINPSFNVYVSISKNYNDLHEQKTTY